MQRRFIAAIAAVLLAGLGAVLLYSWVSQADARALAGTQPSPVFVATKPIPAGTNGTEISAFVEIKQIPNVAVVPGAITDLAEVTDLATTSNIAVGEQLISTRFGEPGTTSTGEVAVPDGLQAVTIQLDASRVSGAQAGDKVAVFMSQDEVTGLALRDILVVKVEAMNADSKGGAHTVTLALEPNDATRVVYTAEFGTLYLSVEPEAGASTGKTKVNSKNFLK